MSRNRPVIVDLYAGAGGEHTGMINAFRKEGIDPIHIGVNHWDRAIETLTKNHPDVREYRARVESLDPSKVVPGRRVHTLWASPSCVYHSRAGGKRSMDDQDRTQPWSVLDWIDQLYVEHVWVENVPELLLWGSLDSKGHRIKSREGETFNAWIAAIRSMGYRVDWRILNSADFGVPQTRRRLFVQAARDRAKLTWPSSTHSKDGGDLFDLDKWRGAKECIDQTIPRKMIHMRKKPLSSNTVRRIAAGIKKHWKVDPEPFMVYLRGTSEAQISGSSAPMDAPLRSISAGGAHAAMAEPMFLPQHSGGTAKGISNPLSTIATTGSISLLEPLLVEYYGNGGSSPVSLPMSTLTTKGRHGLLEASVSGLSYRMLDDGELALGQGFPKGYQFSGNKTERIKQIGNAVPPPVAEALIRSSLERA